MIWLAAGALMVALLAGGLGAFSRASVTQVKWALAAAAAAFGLVLTVLLLATGRGGQAFWAMALLGPVLLRWWRARRPPATLGTGPGTVPEERVETAMLAMRLDPATGLLSGRVRQGRQAGRDLSDLQPEELRGLMEEAAARDPDSVPLIEAFADRAHPGWREAGPPPATGMPDRAEALAVLGLHEGASEAEIRAAHARLMRAAHPDAGGSDWLAARLNAARDILLG